MPEGPRTLESKVSDVTYGGRAESSSLPLCARREGPASWESPASSGGGAWAFWHLKTHTHSLTHTQRSFSFSQLHGEWVLCSARSPLSLCPPTHAHVFCGRRRHAPCWREGERKETHTSGSLLLPSSALLKVPFQWLQRKCDPHRGNGAY